MRVVLSPRQGFGAIFALHLVRAKVSELFLPSPIPRQVFEAVLAYGSVEGLKRKIEVCFLKKVTVNFSEGKVNLSFFTK